MSTSLLYPTLEEAARVGGTETVFVSTFGHYLTGWRGEHVKRGDLIWHLCNLFYSEGSTCVRIAYDLSHDDDHGAMWLTATAFAQTFNEERFIEKSTFETYAMHLEKGKSAMIGIQRIREDLESKL